MPDVPPSSAPDDHGEASTWTRPPNISSSLPFWLKAQAQAFAHCRRLCGDHFCSQVSRGTMPRRGWSAFPIPSGWYDVIRGPRPPSVQWPRRQQWPSSNQWRGWPDVSESWAKPVRRRWHRDNAPRLNPDQAKAVAQTRVARLESVLSALGETDSAEARGLQTALKEAQRAAQERPFAVQAEECQAFIKRSQGRLVRLEEEWVREQAELDAALARMARFREELTQAPRQWSRT